MITVVDARKNYGDFAALDKVTLDIPAGSLTALLAVIALATLLAMTLIAPRREEA